MRMNRKDHGRLTWTGLFLIACAIAGFQLSGDDDLFELRKNFEIFGAVYKTLAGAYVDDPEPAVLMQSGIEAMLGETDPYTVFMDEADIAAIRLRQQSGYGGVGLELGRRDGGIAVLAPLGDAGAYRQGIRTGDVLIEIDGAPADELSLADAHTLLRGGPGTTVRVKVRRPGAPEPLQFVLTRQELQARAVSYHGLLNGGVGYIKLEQFGRAAGEEVRSALAGLQDSGALQGLVLDLRNNPGGLLEEAVTIAGLFLDEGTTVVTMRGRTDESRRRYGTSGDPAAPDLPVVVLVNDYSASASEIVAGAMQDLDRGVIMGDTTYGKGLVQTIERLPFNTALKVTIARYYTPGGRSIRSADYFDDRTAEERFFRGADDRHDYAGHGIAPDIIADAEGASPLEEALRRQAAYFRYASHYAAGHNALPDDFEVDDALLIDFRAWLDEQDISYTTPAEKTLAVLQAKIVAADYAVEAEVMELEEAIGAAKQLDFDQERASISAGLLEAILARYLSEEDRIEATLAHDAVVQQAIELLRDGASYRQVIE